MATWKRILVEDDVVGDGIITVTGIVPHTVRLGDPAGLTELTSPVNGNAGAADKMLIWDESASEWKWIDTDNFPQIHLGNSDLTQTNVSRTFTIPQDYNLQFKSTEDFGLYLNETDGEIRVQPTRIGTSTLGRGFVIKGLEEETGLTTYAERSKLTIATPSKSTLLSTSVGHIEFWGSENNNNSSVAGDLIEYASINTRVDEHTAGNESGAVNFSVRQNNLYTTGGIPIGTTGSTVLRLDQTGVRINGSYDSSGNEDHYYLPKYRGTSGQVLTTDGNGNTSWGEASASVDYNSIYQFEGVAEADLPVLNILATQTSCITLHLPDHTDTGVNVVEGTGITITSSGLTDTILIQDLPGIAAAGTVTIEGSLYVYATQSFAGGAYVQIQRGAGGSWESYYSGQECGILLMQGTPWYGGIYYLQFSYVLPQIGSMSNLDAVEDLQIYFKFKKFSGGGNQKVKLDSLKITISE